MKCIRCGKEMTPTTGGNYYCVSCDIRLNDLVYRTTTTNFLQTDDDKIIESKTEYYCIKCEEKDQRIKELEEKNENRKEIGLALYIALVKELEKRGLHDDIPSVIDQLVGKNCGEYSNMYNEYKYYKNKCIELRNYIMNYYDDGVNRPQQCNEYIRATCNDILEKMKRLKMI